MKRAVIVSGLPASGKTTVARQLAKLLKLPLLDKDDFLEGLYEKQFPKTREDRRQLSKISDTLFQQAAVELDSVVLVSHWRPICGPQNTGTPTGWLRGGFSRIVEVHCACSPEVATSRFMNRTRHPGHRDQDRPPAELSAAMEQMANGYPLGVGPAVTINTDAVSGPSKLADNVAVACRTSDYFLDFLRA